MFIIIIIIIIIIIGSTALGEFGLLKRMSPATSIPGSRQPVSTAQLPCVFLYPVSLP
jgi:hypothetical protein